MRMVMLLQLALATSAIAMTITKSVVFAKPRTWIKAKSTFLGELFSCPYCMSHWVAFTLVALSGVHAPLDFVITSFAVITLAAMGCGLIYHAMAWMTTTE